MTAWPLGAPGITVCSATSGRTITGGLHKSPTRPQCGLLGGVAGIEAGLGKVAVGSAYSSVTWALG